MQPFSVSLNEIEAFLPEQCSIPHVKLQFSFWIIQEQENFDNAKYALRKLVDKIFRFYSRSKI